MQPASQTGFYGKLPCRGDFMQRRAPQEFVDAWDAWLQECLHASRQQLGERWLEAYLTSPIWRFVLAEGVCGESAYAGVMLPSVDRVGRYFPLTVISALEPGTCMLEAACETGRAWFEAAERLALGALEAGDLDMQAFDAEVDALPGLGECVELAESSQLLELLGQSGFARSGSPWRIPMLGETPQRALNAFASIELQRVFRPCALWWTRGSEALPPGWLATSGLPLPTGFAAMLIGQWREAGWNSIELSTEMQPQIQTPTAERADTASSELSQPVDVRIAAVHPPLQRRADAAGQARYVLRPEIGLLGLIVPAEGTGSEALADLIADVAHDLAPQATLTARIESARRAVNAALGSPKRAAAGRGGAAAVILFLAEGTECALVWSGPVRAVRIRGGTVMQRVAGERTAPADVAEDAPPAPPLEVDAARVGADDGGLLALLAAPAMPVPAVGVHYDDLDANDLWVFGVDASIPDALIVRLASERPGAMPSLDAESAVPLMLITVQLEPTVA
jgi:type VI secretion system ImpM family protein